jgi:carboxyl-terminal processing protease
MSSRVPARSRRAWAVAVLTACLVCGGCAGLLLGPDPANTPEANFDALWTEFDRLYALFELKGIDWDSLYAVYRPHVTPSTSDGQLFDIMAETLAPLNDGHVYLIAPFAAFVADQARAQTWKHNFSLADVESGYLLGTARRAGGGRFLLGYVAPGIGYLHIGTFEDENFGRIDDWAKDIDSVMAALKDATAMIVDVRDNGGGDAFNAQYIADRFADKQRLFAYGMSRDGPGHDDFTAPFAWYVAPDGPRQFTGPIVLITNRGTASAAERFTLSLKVLPYVILMGDTTEGAFPHAVPRELPNGWSYRVTTGIVLGPNHESYEGAGIPPDVAVSITPADSINRRDTILERAIVALARAAHR